MIVPSKASPHISTLFSRGDNLNLTNLEFYSLGREALLSGLIALDIQNGDSIIIPGRSVLKLYLSWSNLKTYIVYLLSYSGTRTFAFFMSTYLRFKQY